MGFSSDILTTASHELSTSTPDAVASTFEHPDMEMADHEQAHARSDGVLEQGLAQMNKEQAKPAEQPSEQALQTEPYCAFTSGTKLFIVLTVSMAGFFSPFSINIYIPALPQISNMLHTSEAATNVTVTIYMIAQGLSPVIWAPLSDVS